MSHSCDEDEDGDGDQELCRVRSWARNIISPHQQLREPTALVWKGLAAVRRVCRHAGQRRGPGSPPHSGGTAAARLRPTAAWDAPGAMETVQLGQEVYRIIESLNRRIIKAGKDLKDQQVHPSP